MALFLIYCPHLKFANSSRINSVLVDAEDESEARRVANDNAPNGESKVPISWFAVKIAGIGTLPANPLYFDGNAASLVGFRGA